MKRPTKAIIAAAGFGTRFLPQTKAMPKEMMPLIDKPIIQYVVEELVEAGIKDIIIVGSSNKRAIEEAAETALARLGVSLDIHKPLKELPIAPQDRRDGPTFVRNAQRILGAGGCWHQALGKRMLNEVVKTHLELVRPRRGHVHLWHGVECAHQLPAGGVNARVISAGRRACCGAAVGQQV